MSSSDDDEDLGMVAAFALLDECAPDSENNGDLFRFEVARAKEQDARERSCAAVEGVLEDARMQWAAETLREYNLHSVVQLQALFAAGTAVDVLQELGCTEPEVLRLGSVLEALPRKIGKQEVMAWLQGLPRNLGLDMEAIGAEDVDGETLAIALQSTRELKETFGLASLSSRLKFEAAARNFLGLDHGGPISAELPRGAAGQLYSAAFVEAVKPLYDLHMGTENMGPLLYALIRFVKPLRVRCRLGGGSEVEVGAGGRCWLHLYLHCPGAS
eukprot:TRINITY_DN1114_c0_g2_i2.p2 TRINITY_DN1114_c0_g2~~TRINITY_DN1114_c0_g2_i2.p2  ORF type:complete len:272 (-),score=48.79 TRINITY_DN1114_c0_g2_i2:226-1041(-)